MDTIYRFKPHLRPVPVNGVGVFLIGERERYLLAGELYTRLCPYLDGQRTFSELVMALDGRLTAPEVLYGIRLLLKAGYLCTAESGASCDCALLWSANRIDPLRAAVNLHNYPVAVETLGSLQSTLFLEALKDVGLQVQHEASMRIVLVEDYLAPELDRVNLCALREKQAWMLVKPQGIISWIGPVFQPGTGPCWACLAQRLRGNRPVENFIQRRTGAAAPVLPPSSPARVGVQATFYLAALGIARWIATGERDLFNGQLLTLNQATLQTEMHTVVRRPQCPACGEPSLLANRGFIPIRLEGRCKTFTEDGGHRCAPPQDTYERYQHHISSLTGIISSLGALAERDHPLRPIYAASHFVTPAIDTPKFDDFQQGSLGKGRTVEQAHTSALCEAIERWSALYQGDEPRLLATFTDLGDQAIHPQELLHFSAAQYQMRERWNQQLTDPRLAIPLRFDEQCPIEWSPLWSLTKHRLCYVPTAYCYANVPPHSGEQFCRYTSNGHAAGNCIEEALLQGFFELVERDAAAIWWYNRVQRPAVALESFDEPYFLALREHYHTLGWDVWVCDLTTDLTIPTFVAVAHQLNSRHFVLGLGSHFDARLGVQRALTELNQLFQPGTEPHVPWDKKALVEANYLFPDGAVKPTVAEDFVKRHHSDLRDDLHACIQLADRLGLEFFGLDQTRPDVGLSVVKVVVPGLRHIWPRVGPGRLYEVPARMGWVETARTEAQLNPVSLFL